MKRPFDVGARVVIKWHREQFSAIAKNCRSDGKYFLLGVRREAGRTGTQLALPAPAEPNFSGTEAAAAAANDSRQPAKARDAGAPAPPEGAPRSESAARAKAQEAPVREAAQPGGIFFNQASALANIKAPRPAAPTRAGSSELPRASSRKPSRPVEKQASSSRHERKAMASKSIFPKFWRRQQDEDAPRNGTPKEAPMNSSSSKVPAAETINAPGRELLSYDDIYHAAGIMGPRSGYGIHKVVEMLNSQRIRELAPDIKRASVLMALDAAGTSVDDILQDATRRQHALNTYETAQRKQLEEFEAQKSRENAQIEGEMERIRAHYEQRIQNNRDQVTREKESLRNWQMAMQHESQRISEVIELCGKQPAAAAPASPSTQTPAAEKASSTHA